MGSVLASVGLVVYAAAVMLLLVVASSTALMMLHAWTSPETLQRARFAYRDGVRFGLRFSLIVPARHEQQVLGRTLTRLVKLDYANYEVIVVVGHDDTETADVAWAVAERYPDRIQVRVDRNWPKNKPKALNTGLAACTGDVVGVFDAEDVVHPQLLTRIDQVFAATGAHVVQSGVQLMNFHSSWFSVRNVLEYFFWFSSRLHLQARHGFVPLGGNTVFIRTPLLVALGGWDPDCLAEDAEIGTRLSAAGARIEVIYDPEVVTQEETPATIGALVRQRTRWNQGFLQVLRKGHWLALPPLQRLLAAFTLVQPFLQALIGVLIPVTIGMIFVLPVSAGLAVFSFMPLYALVVTLAVEVAGLGVFGRSFGRRPRTRDYLRLIFGLIPYQLLLSYAALRAAGRQLAGHNGWEKTAHIGAHLGLSPTVTEVAVR